MRSKKGGLLLFLVLLLSTTASAEITLVGPSREVYNLGDKAFVSGSLLFNSDVQGTFEMRLVCRDSTTLQVRNMKLFANEKHSFFENATIPRTAEGQCTIRAMFTSTNITESTNSGAFTVSRDLQGSFVVENPTIQLGQENVIKGNVYKLNGEELKGIVEILMKQGSETRMFGTQDVSDGSVEYLFNSTLASPGSYDVEITARDLYGNEKKFENALSFTVHDKIEAEATIKSQTDKIKPGEKIIIDGMVSTPVLYSLNDAEVQIRFDDVLYKTTVKDSAFSYELQLQDNIKSGSHTILIHVEDEVGNNGDEELVFTIEPVPTILLVTLDQESALPKQEVSFKLLLHDQANDLIPKGSAQIKLLDPNKKMITEKNANVNEKISLAIPEFSPPGDYFIAAESGSLKTEKKLLVERVEELSYSITEGVVWVFNKGNVPYKKTISVKLISENRELQVSEKLNLKPNATQAINLNKRVPANTYNTSIPSISDSSYITTTIDQRSLFTKMTGNFVTGQTVGKVATTGGYLILLIILLLVAALIYYRYFSGKKRYKEYEEHGKDADELNEYLRFKRQKKKEKIEHPERNDPEIQSFIKKSLKEAQKAEKKERKDDNMFKDSDEWKELPAKSVPEEVEDEPKSAKVKSKTASEDSEKKENEDWKEIELDETSEDDSIYTSDIPLAKMLDEESKKEKKKEEK